MLAALNAFARPRRTVTQPTAKVMAAIDWMPKRNGCVAVSAVKNVNFDERVLLSGQVGLDRMERTSAVVVKHKIFALEWMHNKSKRCRSEHFFTVSSAVGR